MAAPPSPSSPLSSLHAVPEHEPTPAASLRGTPRGSGDARSTAGQPAQRPRTQSRFSQGAHLHTSFKNQQRTEVQMSMQQCAKEAALNDFFASVRSILAEMSEQVQEGAYKYRPVVDRELLQVLHACTGPRQ